MNNETYQHRLLEPNSYVKQPSLAIRHSDYKRLVDVLPPDAGGEITEKMKDEHNEKMIAYYKQQGLI
jgi:hypothetical protein